MPSLAELQADFAAALTDPARPAPETVLRQVDLPQSRRFDVYRNNMMVSLIEAMEATFPVLRRLVGADFFQAAAKTYIGLEPPRSPVLLLYGRGFGDFLDGFDPAKDVPYLGDVARLEWAWLNAYHAADAEPLSIDALAEIPQAGLEGLRFTLHPSLQLLRSRFPVVSLWAVTSGADPTAGVDMTRGEAAAVLRPAAAVDVRLLPPGGYDFMQQLAAGHGLAQAAGAASESCSDFDLATHLQGLFELGAVVGLKATGSNSQEA